MCGIAGSNVLEKAYKLYCDNLTRGSHSSGFLAFDEEGSISLLKVPGTLSLSDISQYKNSFSYFLFHSRAPTNSTQVEWSDARTHPFIENNYYVAHNGIISNFKDFNSLNYEVDSAIIPFLLNQAGGDIPSTYSKLYGLLSSWIYNKNTNQLHIVRGGSSLWADENSFSSVEFEGSSSLDDGSYFLYNKKFTKIGDFTYENPYFLL